MFIIITILMMIIFWFILIRPQTKQEKNRQLMINSLEANDTIVTYGGLVAKVRTIGEDTLVVDSEGTRLKIKKNAIASKED